MTARAPGPGWRIIPASGTPSSQGRLLAEPARRLVADLPAPGAGRAGIRRPRRDRPRHPGGHRPAQRPRPALDLGAPPTQTTLLPTALCIHPLRNVALAVVC